MLAAAIPLIYAHAAAAQSLSPTRFETVPPGEASQIGEDVSVTIELLKMRYGDTLARRGVHPKDHGCVQARFTINSDIPEKYRAGVFSKPGKTYDAWIRFSNATPTVTPDVGPKGANSRGMAIKLMGVEGNTLLGEQGAKTQDFLLINQPMFAFPDVSEYLEANKIQLANNDDLSKYFGLPPRPEKRQKTLDIVTKIIAPSQLANPLDAQYFSASPFLFGKDKVAKFRARPRDPANPSLTPKNPSGNYLRMAMKKSLDLLSGQPAVFDFQVQLRPGGTEEDLKKSYPIEDASAEWKETPAAPFQNVAVITIGKQNFDYPLQVTECEHFVFTPWHGLEEHQPLGGINRLRLQVYIASSQYRAQTREPSGFPTTWPLWRF
ncbi:MAG: catalase family protein [Beijerinckiaceae bacterium]